ncbi:hypothetical protein LTR53_015003 [Teratosphaeriaceae sp. CCFEE 6253]|nr:hypothetical protein LTR53_015003 [Teratosphaeriaceae sp. CCFEE 6253]
MNDVQQHLQREGRAAYKRKDYAHALERFDSAVARAPSVQLLDNRAACHDKLGHLPAALKDAKQAIQLQKQDPTGYLRAGKVLIKMEKPTVALEIYAYALRHVEHAGQGYRLLRKLHDDLSSQLAPARSLDPLTVLPRELAELVLQHLSFQQRINACRVSKQWAEFIRSVSNLWQHLDLTHARRKVRTSFISRAINTGRRKLTKATLNNLCDLEKTLAALVRHCPLDDLTLLGTGLQSRSLADLLRNAAGLKVLRFGDGTEIGEQTWRQLLEELSSSLESLECLLPRSRGLQVPGVSCERMTTLSISVGVFSDAARFFAEVATFMPNLRSLTARECAQERGFHSFVATDLSALNKLQCLDLHIQLYGIDIIKLPASLQVLRLGARRSTFAPDPLLKTFHLPLLTELSLDVPNSAELLPLVLGTAAMAEQVPAPHLSQLETLKISTSLEPSDLQSILNQARLRHLKHFTLRCWPGVLDQMMVNLKSLLELETVDISGTSVTGVEIKLLVGLPNLKQIVLGECPSVSSDAILWARSRGVLMVDRRKSGNDGGRRVRY